MEKKKVFIPCYGQCEFGSLKEAVNYVKQRSGGLSVYIDKIVFYNVRFRDCLRKSGINGVIWKLIREAPAIAFETKALDELKQRWTDRMKEHIADYDIQCLPKNSQIIFDGCRFDGLQDIDSQVEMAGNPKHIYSKWYNYDEYKYNSEGLHIGRIWLGYPVFDSFDDCDGRSYDNYVFSRNPITTAMMDLYCEQVSAGSNFCMVHEYIPKSLLPILYYDGDSDNVLLATTKKCYP